MSSNYKDFIRSQGMKMLWLFAGIIQTIELQFGRRSPSPRLNANSSSSSFAYGKT
jgi:hypothetical protein